MNAATTLLDVRGLSKRFPVKGKPFSREKRVVHAVDDVSFAIGRGEVVGLVGESGSGKTTVGRTIMRLTDPTEGEIVYEGTDISHLSARDMMAFRRKIQMVFQDPFASLNPRIKVG